MRKIIYIGFVGFLFIVGFLNLDGNDWEPVELPKFITNLFDSGEKILPIEQWEEILVGTWKFKTKMGTRSFEGTVSYYQDNTFERKVTYKRKRKDITERASGTVKGTWSISKDDNSWLEVAKSEDCKILPELYDVCSAFTDSIYYGGGSHSVLINELLRFNYDKIEIRSLLVNGNEGRFIKLTKVD